MPRTELFIGNLQRDVQRKDIEDAFEKYGKLLRCDIKNRGSGPAYCFLEFEEERDAEDALRAENGKDLMGNQMHVEWAKSRPSGGDRGGGFRGGDRRDGGGFRRGGGGRDFGGDRRGGGFRGGSRGGPSGGRGGECYECGERGHFARDCPKGGGGGRRGGGGRDRDRNGGGRRRDSNSRSKSRSRSRDSNRSRRSDD